MMNNSNNFDAPHPDVLQILKSDSGTLSSVSYSGQDLISFSENRDDLISFEEKTYVTELSSRPPSATSFLEDGGEWQLGIGANVKPAASRSVYVTISGTSFSVPQDAFAKLAKLNWTRDRDGQWQLNTSPAIFEILLSYLLFDTLPAIDTLSNADYAEFEPMALSLKLYELVEHFDRSSDKRFRSNKERRRSLKHKHNGIPIVLNSENMSVTSVKFMAANTKCARFVASLNRKCSNRLRARRTKTTHEQWCARSDHVN